MTPAELERQHQIAEVEATAQGLPKRLEDPSAQSRILSALGLPAPTQPARSAS